MNDDISDLDAVNLIDEDNLHASHIDVISSHNSFVDGGEIWEGFNDREIIERTTIPDAAEQARTLADAYGFKCTAWWSEESGNVRIEDRLRSRVILGERVPSGVTLCHMLDTRLVQAFKESLGHYDPTVVSSDGVGDAANRAARHFAYNRGAKGVASTGTPIPTIHGAARDNAIRSNAGGGPVSMGGLGKAGGDVSFARTGSRAGFVAELAFPYVAAGCHIALSTGYGYVRAVWRDRNATMVARGSAEAERSS